MPEQPQTSNLIPYRIAVAYGHGGRGLFARRCGD